MIQWKTHPLFRSAEIFRNSLQEKSSETHDGISFCLTNMIPSNLLLLQAVKRMNRQMLKHLLLGSVLASDWSWSSLQVPGGRISEASATWRWNTPEVRHGELRWIMKGWIEMPSRNRLKSQALKLLLKNYWFDLNRAISICQFDDWVWRQC